VEKEEEGEEEEEVIRGVYIEEGRGRIKRNGRKEERKKVGSNG
jgi:hypothetical protein